MAPPKLEPVEIQPIYFKVHLRILFYLGIDIIPVESPILRVVFYFYAFVIIGLMCIFTLTEFLDLVLNFEGIEKMTFNLCYFVTHVLGTVKMFLMMAQRKQLWHHFHALETGIFKPNMERGGVKEFELVKDAIKLCKLQGYVFYTLVIIIISARTIYAATANWPYDKNNYVDGNVTVIVNTKIMPYTTWMPFDFNVSPFYELIFTFQIFSTVVYGFYIGATDAVICGFMILIKAQFLIVKNTLDKLLNKAQNEEEAEDMNRIELLDEKTQNAAAKLTNECVFHHQELIAFCDQAEDTFCYLMLLQFLSSLLIVCFQLFQLSTLPPNSVEFFSMLNYFILMSFQILCYCWHGNEVQLVSSLISSYVYNINWIILNEPTKKSLLLLMMRSQRPCYFTAGKFSLLSLQTFMTIIRGAASYFMFLRQMNS